MRTGTIESAGRRVVGAPPSLHVECLEGHGATASASNMKPMATRHRTSTPSIPPVAVVTVASLGQPRISFFFTANFDPQILSRNRKFRRNFDTLFEDLHGTVKFAPHKLGPTGLLLAACLACATVRSQCRLIGCSVLSPAFLALSAGVVVVTWFARTGVGMYG